MAVEAIGVQQVLSKATLGVEAVKSTIDAQKAIANIVEEASNNVPTSSSVGTNLDVSV